MGSRLGHLLCLPGGGRVDAISELTAGRKDQGLFLFSATVELLEQYGFCRRRAYLPVPGGRLPQPFPWPIRARMS